MRVAAFDVDGTLTERDCVVPFLRLIGGTVGTGARMLRAPSSLVMSVGRRDRDALKASASRAAFAGRDLCDVDRQALRFAQTVAGEWLRADTVARLRAHQESGDTVVLVSASYALYLDHLAVILDVEAVLATQLALDADGRLTGQLDGPNCRGAEKVVRLHRWLDQHAGGRAAAHVTAYGDSAGDREMLLDADDAVWVGSGSPDWLH